MDLIPFPSVFRNLHGTSHSQTAVYCLKNCRFLVLEFVLNIQEIRDYLGYLCISVNFLFMGDILKLAYSIKQQYVL